MLRYDGDTYIASMGNVLMSFVCGPYIMLQMGWSSEDKDAVEMGPALFSAMVAFGWAFLTGLLFVGIYVTFRF
ncbi:hypothetical protein VW29_12410 [Devosia limi DSM 17137]|nr:hypothetical protein VW29_12410 [Devosia limi DSM 17137]